VRRDHPERISIAKQPQMGVGSTARRGCAARRVLALATLALTVLGSLATSAGAQLLVHPRRPGQTNVRYAHFDWRYVDLLREESLELDLEWERGPRFHLHPYRPPAFGAAWAWPTLSDAPIDGPHRDVPSDQAPATAPEGKERLAYAGGVRLYFYERERAIAERAAASIEDSYRYLAEQFGYAPQKTFAYFLYSSYIEFLQTDLFPVQEGVLGVTSPESLDLTLPYFGDHRMFEDVSTHELAHEFTVQKLLSVAYEADLPDAPLQYIPLWFIEGLAEYYAKRGLDPEAEVLVRDLIVNPNPDGYTLGDFFEDRFTDGLWTYKVGQARCAFLEEQYGKGTIQHILEESPRLLRSQKRGGVTSFRALVSEVTGDRPSRISARFERWVKRRAFRSFLDTSQDRVDMGALAQVEGLVQALSTSPSGQLLLYRSIDPDTGATSLFLVDRHAPADTTRVAIDGSPGVESLHPVSGRNFDLNDTTVAFAAERGGRDVIYVQRFEHDAVPEPCAETGPRSGRVCRWEVELELGPLKPLEVGRKGILAVEALALSPNGRSVAFIGLAEDGRKDVFLIADVTDPELSLLRLTHDAFGEREVSFGPKSIVFTSDETGHGKYNLFRIDPALPTVVERLTYAPVDQFDPEVLPDGRVLFASYDEAGANLYEVKGGKVLRHTDVPTGLYDVSTGPDGSVWALYHHSHKRVPVRLAASTLLARDVNAPTEDAQVVPLAHRSLSVDREYDPFDFGTNWAPDGFFILAGFSGDAVFGSLVATASDRLHDHALILSSSVFGSFDLTDAELTYVNQERRLIWGLGVFHDVSAIYDQSFEQSDDVSFLSYQRFFGSTGILRYPFSRFFYVQGELALGGSEYFVTDETRERLHDPMENRAMRDLYTPWDDFNGGMRFHTEAGASVGYSTIGLHRSTGPIRGSGLLLSHSVGTQPWDDVTYQQTRIDAEHYFQIAGATNLMLRGAGGTTFGDRRAPQFFLSSFHTLRGVPFGDIDFLLGREFFYSTAELQFPIVTFVDFPLVDLEGVLAMDFGGVGDGFDGLWRRRVFDLVFGFNLGFAPIVLRIHFAQPIGIGAPVPNDGDLTFNLSLVWRYR
jgi:hypothetical protein